jgi:hypothetical protein
MVVAAVSAGCAAPQRPGGPAQPPPSTAARTRAVPAFADPLAGAAPSSAPPARVAPTSPPATIAGTRLVSVPWRLVAITHGGRRVVVQYRVAGCAQLSHVVLRQTRRWVELGVQLADSRRPGRICPAYTTSARSAVVLERPLGGRALVHAPSTR